MSKGNLKTDPMKSKRLRGYAALWLGVFTSSLSPILVKGGDAPTIVTTFYRMAIAAVFWTLVVLERTIRGKESLFREVRGNHSWLIFPVAAGFCSSFDHGLWSLALNTESVNKASVLNSLSPVWISLVGLLILKEKFNKKFWIGLALVIAGMVITSGKGQSLFSGGLSGGDLLAFCSSFFYAGYFFFTQLGRRRFDPDGRRPFGRCVFIGKRSGEPERREGFDFPDEVAFLLQVFVEGCLPLLPGFFRKVDVAGGVEEKDRQGGQDVSECFHDRFIC